MRDFNKRVTWSELCFRRESHSIEDGLEGELEMGSRGRHQSTEEQDQGRASGERKQAGGEGAIWGDTAQCRAGAWARGGIIGIGTGSTGTRTGSVQDTEHLRWLRADRPHWKGPGGKERDQMERS